MPKRKMSSSSISVNISAKNSEQKDMLRTISQNSVTFVRGFPGSGKTHLAVGFGLQALLRQDYEQLIFTRPVVEAGGERLGFLPGNMYEKIDPYMIPIFEILSKLLPQGTLNQLMPKSNGHGNGDMSSPIRILPLAYMRGTAQPLYSPIATPQGWKTMGAIKTGDMVIGSNGEGVQVVKVFPHIDKKIYRVGFSDGSSVDCCDEHLWNTKTLSEKRHSKPFSTKNTEQISKSLKTRFGQKNHEIPLLSSPIQFEEKDTPIDSYALGLLLGDGSLHKKASIQFTTTDTELIDQLADRLPDIEIKYAGKYDYRLVKKATDSNNWLKNAVKDLGLCGTKSYSKFVPDIYKYNSPEVRIDMIRGLLDSDGYITTHHSGRRRINFYTISDYLAHDMVEMIQSLGGIAYMRQKKYRGSTSRIINGHHEWIKTNEIKFIWCIDIVFDGCNLFRLSRKADIFSKTKSPRPKRFITSVEYLDRMDCKCIQVDDPNHLYVTDSSVLTHNTFSNSFIFADEMQNSTPEQMRMVLTRLGTNSTMVLCGDVYQTDIRSTNGLFDAFEKLQNIDGVGFVTLTQEAIMRHPIIQQIENRYLNRKS